ncbi:MAG: FHA domain-containing protein [Chloroflexota bacterium]
MAYGRLDVFWPDGLFKTYNLADSTVSIGRSNANSISLDTDTLSRYHSTLTYKDGEVQIADLDSANGTFVDGVRLKSGEPRTLYGGEEILIGELRMVYHFLDETPTRPITVPEEVTRRIELEEAPFYIDVAGPEQAIPPGAHISARVSITNTSDAADRYRVEVSGVSKDWARIDRPDLEIAPSQSADVIINFKPRRRSDSTPGEYVVTITVYPKKKPDVRLQATIRLHVLSYGGFGMALENNRLTTADRFRLHLHNQGSAPLPINLIARDLSDGLTFSLPNPHFTLAPGQRTVVQGQVKPKSTHFFGDAREYPFDLIARSGDAAAFTISARAYLDEKPSLPSWAAFAFGGIALAVLAVIAVGLFVLLQPAPPQPAITGFQVSASRLAQGEPLIVNWTVDQADDLRLTVNGTPIPTDPQSQGVQIDTSSLNGVVTVGLTAANGALETSTSQTVQVFRPISVTRFSIDPPRLVLYVAQSITLSWAAPGALSTRITGLENFATTPLDAAYGEAASVSLVGIPTGSMNLILHAVNTDTQVEQPLTVEMISPQCNASSGDASLRGSPNSRDQVIATIPLGTTVIVDAQDATGQWLRVQLSGGVHGWGERAAFTCASTFSVDDLYRELNVPTPQPELTIIPTLNTATVPTASPTRLLTVPPPTRAPATFSPSTLSPATPTRTLTPTTVPTGAPTQFAG